MSLRGSWLSLALFALAACGDGTGNDTSTTCNEANEDCTSGSCSGSGGQMLPGSDCTECHGFTAAGTIFADLDGTEPLASATIRVTDSLAVTVEMTSNSAGNFYTNDALEPPLTGEVEVGGTTVAMVSTPSVGGCNSCHSCTGTAGGKLIGP
jgi:hypothetical protein